VTRDNELDQLDQVCKTLQADIQQLRDELDLSKGATSKNESNYKQAKHKLKEVERDRDRLNDKLKKEREQTRLQNQELMGQ